MKHKTVIVTGGSSGIGRCAAIALRDAGFTVYEFSRRDIPLEGVTHMTVDVTEEEAVKAAVDKVAEQGLDLVVNCAGFGISGAVEFTELSEAKRQFDVNFFGMVNVNKAALPHLRKTKGRIISVSSVAAVAHIPFQTYYSAAKAAMESYTCALANEVRPFGVSVTVMQPGDIRTGFTQSRAKCPAGDDVYEGRIGRSVRGMEKDEENGMSPEAAGRYLLRIAKKRRVKPIYTLGLGYKCLSVLCKVLPCRLRNWVVGLLYAR